MRVDLNALRQRHTSQEPPPCRVCGGELQMQSAGGGRPTKYACPCPDGTSVFEWSNHYRASEWEDRRHSDSEVLELIDLVERVQALFAGGPDTPCRTTWRYGVEYVEVPMDDLRRALSDPADESTMVEDPQDDNEEPGHGYWEAGDYS